jgi:hypothetical protein
MRQGVALPPPAFCGRHDRQEGVTADQGVQCQTGLQAPSHVHVE